MAAQFIPVTVMPWHKPDPCMPPKMQTPAAFKPSYLDYMSSLHMESKTLKSPLTCLMCTIGPSSSSTEIMVDLMDSGMGVALVHMDSKSREEIQDVIKTLQGAVTSNSTIHNRVIPLAIAVQLRSPGVHIGAFDRGEPVILKTGEQIMLTGNLDWKYRSNAKMCYFDLPNPSDILTRGDRILMNSGLVKLDVDDISGSKITCSIVDGGELTNNMKVNIPGVPLHLAAITGQDKDDLEFIATTSSVDIVIVPSVRCGDHPKEVREILRMFDCDSILVYSRIDSKDGMDNVLEIARESDGVVLARNELSAEIKGNKLFLAQKIVTSTCNKMGKPVYVCANYMESMTSLTTPSYSEVIDLQSAILDGADGILLESPTAEGLFPDDVVKAVSEICEEAEAAVWQSQIFSSLLSLALPPMDPTHAISISAVESSLKSCAAAIVLATTSGRSAQLVARYRPRCHIIAITRYGQVARQLNAYRAILPVHYTSQPLMDWNKEVDIRLQMGIEFGKEKGLITTGDPIVLVNGWRKGAGFTNTLRVVYASDSDPWVYPHPLPPNMTELITASKMDRGVGMSSNAAIPSIIDQWTSYDFSLDQIGESIDNMFNLQDDVALLKVSDSPAFGTPVADSTRLIETNREGRGSTSSSKGKSKKSSLEQSGFNETTNLENQQEGSRRQSSKTENQDGKLKRSSKENGEFTKISEQLPSETENQNATFTKSGEQQPSETENLDNTFTINKSDTQDEV